MNAIVRNPQAVEAVEPIPAPSSDMEVVVARSLDDLMQVMSVRTLAFMGDQSCPYDEEFDGNDFCGATHLLLKVRGEPAGTVRMRWFADFCKLERIALTRRFRGGKGSFALIDAAADLARKKGYRKLLTYAQPRYIPLWQSGFKVAPAEGRPTFTFSDHEYVALEAELTPIDGAMHIEIDPFVLNRPEGDWDRPGVRDRSADRPATNPMVRRAS